MINELLQYKTAVEMQKYKLPNCWKVLPPIKINQKDSKMGHFAFKLPNGDFATIETVYKKSEAKE